MRFDYKIIYILVYLQYLYWPWFVAFAILGKVLQALYLKHTGYDKWYFYLIPLGHLFIKRDLAMVRIGWIVAYFLLLILSWSSFLIWFIIPFIAVTYYLNYKFAQSYVDNMSASIYTFVPFAKYFLYIKTMLFDHVDVESKKNRVGVSKGVAK